MEDERTPLLRRDYGAARNFHEQFCALTGVPPSNLRDHHRLEAAAAASIAGPKTLYGRATRRHAQARRSHALMTALSNTLLLSQVILGATLTALGASESSHVLITAFGVVNTVIAGLVAYLKSRGQPARQRVFRDELERVVDEMENSETMWLGIAEGVHGYDEIDIDDKVTVRSEVARLTRCYDKAVRNYAVSNPDNYLMGQAEGVTALRPRGLLAVPGPAVLPVAPPLSPAPAQTLGVSVVPVPDPDESPASAPSRAPTPQLERSADKAPPDSTKGDGTSGEGEDDEDAVAKAKKRPFSQLKGHRISRSIFNGAGVVDLEGKGQARGN